MVSYTCYVYGCKTGYDSDKKKRKAEGEKKLSLFNAPRDEDAFQKWKRAIPPRSDRELSRKSKVCELHFLPEEISRYYRHKIRDGTEVIIEKGIVNLVANAVPSIFPNLPAYLSKNNKKRKSPAKGMFLPLTKKPKANNIPSKDVSTPDDTVPQFPVSNFIKKLLDVRKPNKFWSVSAHEDFIVCAKWDPNFAPERQIIIDADLGVKVMYYGAVAPTQLTLTNAIHSLSKLISKVDKYELCCGVMIGNESCSIYMERDWGAGGRTHKWCSACRKNILKPQLKQKNPKLALKFKKEPADARLREKVEEANQTYAD